MTDTMGNVPGEESGDRALLERLKNVWHALYTKPRHEKLTHRLLEEKGIESYLPLRKILRQWSDRKKWIEEPLFRSYIFVHVTEQTRIPALRTPGVVRMVSFQGKPAVVQDEEIEAIRRILCEIPDVEACEPLHLGDLVEISRGPLTGICGRLVQVQSEHRLVVLVESIRQALRFNVSRGDIRILS